MMAARVSFALPPGVAGRLLQPLRPVLDPVLDRVPGQRLALARLARLACLICLALLPLGCGVWMIQAMLRASAAPYPPPAAALERVEQSAPSVERILARNLMGLQLQPVQEAQAMAEEDPLSIDGLNVDLLPDEDGLIGQPAAGAPPAQAGQPAPPPDAPWTVTGVVRGEVQSVFVTTANATRVVFLGDELDGWRLTAVQGNRTVWMRQQDTRELELQRNLSQGGASPPALPQPLPTLQRVQARGGRGGGGQAASATPSTHTPSPLPGPGVGAGIGEGREQGRPAPARTPPARSLQNPAGPG